MSKILVSDLIGTLIPTDAESLEYLYGKDGHIDPINLIVYTNDNEDATKYRQYYEELKDKFFVHLRRDLDSFFKEGNYLYVVTAVDSHESASLILKEFIRRLYYNFKNYEEQIEFFFKGRETDLKDLAKVTDISEENGSIYVKSEDGIVVNFIDDKTKVFDFVKEKHDLTLDELFSIGDTKDDIPMLLKCIELGGKSSIIDNFMYRKEASYLKKYTTDGIIQEAAWTNFEIMLEDIVKEQYPDIYGTHEQFSLINKLKREKIALFKEEVKRLYMELLEEKLDLNELFEKAIIMENIELYFSPFDSHYRLTGIIPSRKIKDEFSIYPTIRDYSNKVLTKSEVKYKKY